MCIECINPVRSPKVHINMQQREDSEERVENEVRKHLLRLSAIINYTVINGYYNIMQLQTGWKTRSVHIYIVSEENLRILQSLGVTTFKSCPLTPSISVG